MNAFSLILKSLSGLFFLLVLMGVALFLPYGSMDYPLAWLYLGVFAASIGWITAYLFLFDKHLLQSRLAAGPVSEKRRVQKVIQSLAGLAFLAVYVVSALDFRHQWSRVPLPLAYAAEGLCAGAFILLFFVFRENTFLSATVEVQAGQQVVSTGLYGLVRHPMYTGALLLLTFTPLALGSFWGLLSVVVLAVIIAYRALDEEKELTAKLPGYKQYCEKVRYRLLPFVY